MNRPIRRVAIVAALMFFALLANASYLGVFRASSLEADSRNRRARDAEFAVDRGAILVGNTPVAQTKASTGRFKYQRTYPKGSLYAPVTGYYSYDFGRSGLESTYNTQLSGTDDSQFFERMMDTLTGKKAAGASLQTTINAKAQQAASDGLGSRVGAVVALDYTTGAILADVTNPSYDPNELATTDLTAEQANWKKLTADTSYPMSNRATREIYPPGSTFKLVTAAAALENGMSASSTVSSPSSLRLPQTSTYLTNETNCGGSTTTLTHALEVSCNTAFANVGLKLGATKLRAEAEKFGFDSSLGGDANPVASQFPSSLNQPQVALSAIGQYDVAASPLQMAVVAGAIANGGQVMQPYLVSEVRNPDLSTLSKHSPQKLQRALSTSNAQSLQTMMQDVVTNGTGTAAQISGLTIGGKTGTAQSDPNRPPYAWFVGYSTQQHVAVAVFIQQANVARSDIAGGALAGPVFRDVVEALR